METRRSTDSDGNTRTEQVKVVTHTANKIFDCNHFVDESPSPTCLHFLDMLVLTRLYCTEIIELTPIA